MPVEYEPVGVAVTPDGTKVYVTNYKSATVSVINTTTNAASDTHRVVLGNTPDKIKPTAFGQFIGSPPIPPPINPTMSKYNHLGGQEYLGLGQQVLFAWG